MIRVPFLQVPAALITVVVLGLWTVSPNCACQWRALLGGPVEDHLSSGDLRPGSETFDSQFPDHCSCDEHPVKVAEASPTHPETPAPVEEPVPHAAVAPNPAKARARGDCSGCDPPRRYPLRTHLMLRRLLI